MASYPKQPVPVTSCGARHQPKNKSRRADAKYWLFKAADDGCLQCVRAYLDAGVSATSTSDNCKYTVKDWTHWAADQKRSGAAVVLAYLEEHWPEIEERKRGKTKLQRIAGEEASIKGPRYPVVARPGSEMMRQMGCTTERPLGLITSRSDGLTTPLPEAVPMSVRFGLDLRRPSQSSDITDMVTEPCYLGWPCGDCNAHLRRCWKSKAPTQLPVAPSTCSCCGASQVSV